MEAPFKVGQKVVCLQTVSGYWVKGNVYTVAALSQCKKCGEWHVQIEESATSFNPSKVGSFYGCTFCPGTVPILVRRYGTDCKNFAPLPEQRERINYVAVSETLRETAVEIAAVETN